MTTLARTLLLASLLVSQVSAPRAQTVPDPSGHWQGMVHGPNVEVPIEIDLTKNDKAEFAGTFAQPTQGVKGFPLSTIAVDGRSVRFVVKAGETPSSFHGTLAADGTSMAGDLAMGGYALTFALKRTGDARITPAPRNAPISIGLEGTWNGALQVGERRMRLTVRMANRPDGTAAGTIVSPDGSGIEIPIGIVEHAANVRIEVASVGASFAGVRNAAASELVGTWTQGGSNLPLTLQRAK